MSKRSATAAGTAAVLVAAKPADEADAKTDAELDCLQVQERSIYALVAHSLASGARGVQLYSVLVALTACVVLQVTLLGLLLRLGFAKEDGNKPQDQGPPGAAPQDHVKPEPSGPPPAMFFFATSLSMLILGLYVLTESAGACRLAYAVAGHAKLLPPDWVRDEHAPCSVCTALRESAWRRRAALCLPLLQLAVCVLCFCTGAALQITLRFSGDIISIIINSVAVSFILELDNKVGELFAKQQGGDGAGVVSPAKPYTTCAAKHRAQRRAGAAYRWALVACMGVLVGAVLFTPPVILICAKPLLGEARAAHAQHQALLGINTAVVLLAGVMSMNLVRFHPLMLTAPTRQWGMAMTAVACFALAACLLALAAKPTAPASSSAPWPSPSPAPGGHHHRPGMLAPLPDPHPPAAVPSPSPGPAPMAGAAGAALSSELLGVVLGSVGAFAVLLSTLLAWLRSSKAADVPTGAPCAAVHVP